MNIVFLSGGSGKRLWPLSNDIRSKQFIKIFKNKDGQYESMLQRMYTLLVMLKQGKYGFQMLKLKSKRHKRHIKLLLLQILKDR